MEQGARLPDSWARRRRTGDVDRRLAGIKRTSGTREFANTASSTATPTSSREIPLVRRSSHVRIGVVTEARTGTQVYGSLVLKE